MPNSYIWNLFQLPVIKRRRKRGGFKKGFLKPKSRRGEQQRIGSGAETTSGHQSEVLYFNFCFNVSPQFNFEDKFSFNIICSFSVFFQQGYTDEMEGLLPTEPDAQGDDSCYCSVAETVPSEGDRDTEADKDDEV